MAKIINVSGALIPTSINTPLDARTVIDTIDDLESISYPSIGLLIYVKSENRFIRVTALGPKKVGPLTVPMAAISEWEYDDKKLKEIEGRLQRIEEALDEETLCDLKETLERAQQAADDVERITTNPINSEDINQLFPEEEEA